MTSIWILHGDSEDYYGIHAIYGVYATRDLAVQAAEAHATADAGRNAGPIIGFKWIGNRLNVLRRYPPPVGDDVDGATEAEISEHTIEGTP